MSSAPLLKLPTMDTLNAEARVTKAFAKPKEIEFGDAAFLAAAKVHFQDECIAKEFESDDKLLDKVISAEYHRRDNAVSITFPATFMDVQMAFKMHYKAMEFDIKLEDKDLTVKGAVAKDETDKAGTLRVDAIGGTMPAPNEIKEAVTPIFKAAGCIIETFAPSNGQFYVQYRDDPEHLEYNAPPALHRLCDIQLADGRLAHFALCANFCRHNNYCRKCSKSMDRNGYYVCQGHTLAAQSAKRPSPSDLARAAMRKQQRK